MTDGARIIAGALIALGLTAGGFLAGQGLVRARGADRSVSMKGLAERDVTADLATWTLAYSATGTDLAALQAQMDRNTAAVRALLARHGFAPAELTVAGIGVNQFRNNGETTITVRQRLQLRTGRIAAARAAFADQADLVRQGVALDDGSGIVYSFTRLNTIKPAMIAAATRDARAAAEQFAKDSGAGVGAIRRATQGLFSIGPRDGDEGGGADSPDKKVRVVTTIDFELE